MSRADWSAEPVTVRVPATSANLGPGFDSLGLALSLHDVVQAQVTGGGLEIEVTGIGEQTARYGERHLVVRAMRAAFGVVGEQPPGLRLRCANAIPHGFGFGSSAAAIVAGIIAARALAGPTGLGLLPDHAVLTLAAALEGHADNVAACQAGGLTIAWAGDGADRAGGASPASAAGGSGAAGAAGGSGAAGAAGSAVRCVRLDPLPGLRPVLCVPAVPLATEAARQVLPAVVPHADAARNAARAALLVAALTREGLARDPELLLAATRDFLHQPYRASSMPHTASLIGALRDAGIPAVVSGAGPAALALVVPGVTPGPEVVVGIVAAAAGQVGADWSVRVLEVDRRGAAVIDADRGTGPTVARFG
ncbi:MAG TPA: homoserine kinase [Streptosporangiaceae bacterium]|nr:homoserine kinase [Streptosporangiaceae bacterium]